MERVSNEKKLKYGSFQKMGLSKELLKGVLSKGYITPTPIQRKVIPRVIDGKDIVATARTGSGKTAAFLIPIFQLLNNHSENGPRALIISPTRDLAIQTMRFTKDIGKYCDLKYALIVGGDSIDCHFAAIHQNPDIIIATPGRILHILVEMSLKLEKLKIVIFDEADRLFELGFSDQLYEILKLVPSNKQSVLLSATLPHSVIHFSKAGLTNPELLKLDVDIKFSPNLKMNFIHCKTQEYKLAVLIHLLVEIIDHDKEKTLIFVSTKYHVDYLKELLDHTHIMASISYSSMDNEARKQHVQRFRAGSTTTMIVTDIAARGLDIPQLDNVINFDFPKSPKLYVHRVGRVARMNRAGFAYSLFLPQELPYVIDLHTFMVRDINLAEEPDSNESNEVYDGITGSVPPSVISNEITYINSLVKSYPEIINLKKKAQLAEKKVKKFNQESSKQSVQYSKMIDLVKLNYHPIFKINNSDMVSHKILHIEHTRSTTNVGTELERVIDASSKIKGIVDKTKKMSKLTNVSKSVVLSRSNRQKTLSKLLDDIPIKNKSSKFIDNKYDNAIQNKEYDHSQNDLQTEFEIEATKYSLDLNNDDGDIDKPAAYNTLPRKWDTTKKRYIRQNNFKTNNKIINEHGVKVDKSFKSNNYKRWLNNNNNGSYYSNDPHERKGNIFGDNNFHSLTNKNNCTATPRQILKKRLKRQEIKKKSSKPKAHKGRKRF